jgi:glycolate oxidase
VLVVEFDGSEAGLDADADVAEGLCLEAGATLVRRARTTAEREALWRGRKKAYGAFGRITPDLMVQDATVPRSKLPEVLAAVEEIGARHEVRLANVFHAGDGNLHPLILYDANQPGQLEKAEAFGARILELCIEAGGTITGEHGVGIEKIDQMCLQFSSAELALFHGIKSAFDERAILNPGKAVPTLHRCAEFGAMHVRRGQEKFPGLDRF